MLHAQRDVTVSGSIWADDGSTLGSATIYAAGFMTGVYSDSSGHFNLTLKKGEVDLSFSYIGYEPQHLFLNLKQDTVIEVMMRSLQMSEVVILQQKELKAANHAMQGVITLRPENFTSLPAFLGESDPIRAVQMQPGIQSGNEGSRGIFVRGGSPDQNLMQLDGATVYNPAHIYGFISVFNGESIDHLDVYKDKYPARFGGRLGSVMDITQQAGNTDKLKGSISVGLVTSRFHLDGPFDKSKATTFSLSARICYVGLFTSPISKHQYKVSGYDGDITYYFGDVNAKLVHTFKKQGSLRFSFFTNNDSYHFLRQTGNNTMYSVANGRYDQRLTWANYVATAAYVQPFKRDWEWSNQLTFSRYQIRTQRRDNYVETDATTGDTSYANLSSYNSLSYINDISWKSEASYSTSTQLLRVGGGISGYLFETGKGRSAVINTYWGNFSNELKSGGVRALEGFAYVDEEYTPGEQWVIAGGFHARVYQVQDKTFASFLPRASLLFKPAKLFFMRASVSGVSQNLHLLATSSADILNDLWVPATAKAAPETGWNFSAGVGQKLPLNFEWSIDGFYRTMKNVIEYNDRTDYSYTTKSWEEQIATGGIGRAYGMEVYVARSAGRVTGSVAYSLGWSKRRFATLNQGEDYPFKYDRRHNIAAQLNYLIGKHFEVGAAWVYGSGNMFTLPVQSYHSWIAAYYNEALLQNGQTTSNTGETIDVYSGKNSYRLPAFHHLDVSFTYKKRSRRLEHLFNFSIYNVYNRFNIFSVYGDYRLTEDGTRKMVYKKLSLFPVMPSIAYTLRFS